MSRLGGRTCSDMWQGTGGDLERLAAALTRRGPDFGRSFEIVMGPASRPIRRIDSIVTQRIVVLRRCDADAQPRHAR